MKRSLKRLLKEDVGQKKSGRWTPQMYRIWVMGPLAVLIAVAAGWTILVLLGGLSGFALSWWGWHDFGKVTASQRTDLVRDTVTTVALLGAVLAGVYAYRKQRLDEAGSHRSDAESLSQRYQDSAEQLGHDKAAVRLAGVYSMERLDDEWPDQRQTCVDVLCSYLRMPWAHLEESAAEEESEIRRTLLTLVGERTRLDAPTNWSSLAFDFRGARLPGFIWTGSVFHTRPTLQRCEFTENTIFKDCIFEQGATFTRATVRRLLSLRGVVLHEGVLSLAHSTLPVESRLTVDMADLGQEAKLDVRGIYCSSHLTVHVRPTPDEQGTVDASGLTVGHSARVEINIEKPATPQLVSTGKVPAVSFGAWSISKSAHIVINEKLGAITKTFPLDDEEDAGETVVPEG